MVGRVKAFLLRLLLISALAPSAALASNSVVNLSHYDMMRVDFDAMHAQGIVGVLHEATYPRNVRDAYYASRQAQATRAGLLWGAYHFANASDPVAQADFFLRSVSSAWYAASPASRPAQVLLVLDFEKNGHYPGGTMRVDQAVAFIERIRQRTGVSPGLYSNENRISSVLNNPSVTREQRRVLQSCWLWIANYHYRPRNVAPWNRWTMWQYTGDGVCDLPRASFPISAGNIRRAERNIFNGDPGDVRSFWQSNGWTPGSARVPTAGE
jgi:lysozyme